MFATIPFIVEDILEGTPPHGFTSLSDSWGLLGLALVLAGVFLRSWAAGIIHKTDTLTTEGPYALFRHPLYIGSLLMGLGVCTLIGDWENFLLVFLILVPLHVRRTLREESKLAEIHGQAWQDYKQRTGAFFPKVVPAGVLAHWSPAQWLNNKEYGAFVTSLIALTLVQLWHMYPQGLAQIIAIVR
jgi:hypothetical protein